MMLSKLLENKIHYLDSIPNDVEEIVLFCHGLKEDKSVIYLHNQLLNEHHIGIVSFDLPYHGEDQSDYTQFTLTNCLHYLEVMINKLEETYPSTKLSLMGDSLGGYIILNYIHRHKKQFYRVLLKYPAVNFWECILRRIKLPEDYFDTHDILESHSGFKASKEACMEFKTQDLMTEFDAHGNQIYIIHGSQDHLVDIHDVEYFCELYKIPLKILKNADHGFGGYEREVNHYLLSVLL